jgi:hypothetical protein
MRQPQQPQALEEDERLEAAEYFGVTPPIGICEMASSVSLKIYDEIV